jgi:hypothetical protein
MNLPVHYRLPAMQRTAMMRGAAFASLLFMSCVASAEEKAPPSDDLDVTMQIIVDPNAKQPEEIVRRIPLPVRTPPGPAPASSDPGRKDEASTASAKGQDRARQAQELGSEMSQSAKERAQQANDQREQARRTVVDERHNPPKPPEPPGRPPR